MKTRYIECRPADLQPGDQLPYSMRDGSPVAQVADLPGHEVEVWFTNGTVRHIDRQVVLTVLRSAEVA